ncbi:MAG: glycerophosphoryl diester phosphodiesterase membrane domain-containing protein [Erysipelotrichaceae bacterium]|nr:glycerophosphoryl diester phosphodiesterase membrane domain-containing protein [Erysipelotrichaceae bacterium]
MKEADDRLKPYLEELPDIIKYQVVSKFILGVLLFILGRLFRALLSSTGRVAVTSGDFAFLFQTWQGILIILIALISLFMYVALDLNAKIIMSKNLLMGEDVSVWKSCSYAVERVSALFNLEGLGVVIYIILIAPITGIGFSVSLTRGFYIPSFISSVIVSTPLYLILATTAGIIFISIGITNLFILHGVVIDRMPLKDANRQSRTIMHNNWKDFLFQNVRFIMVIAVVIGIVTLIVLILPLFLTSIIPMPEPFRRWLIIFFLQLGMLLSLLCDLMATPFYMMKATQLYFTYKSNEEFHYRSRPNKIFVINRAIIIVVLLVLIGTTAIINNDFDRLFPLDTSVKIIAHRGGGIEGAENTVSGLKKACQLGAFGSEIDIQRTKDGHYILNHDGNFSRVAGDGRRPEEMTLSEIRSLSVDGEPIPTFEEILEASKGKIILFTELKGNTADKQMADDAVRIVKEYGMEDEVVFISLKYDLIDYIETYYPEMHTGFLTFASFGDTALLNCDYLALEEESATIDAIAAVHKQGKKVMVWTANRRDAQRYFFSSSADAVITDNVVQATEVIKEIKSRSDIQRVIDRIKEIIS